MSEYPVDVEKRVWVCVCGGGGGGGRVKVNLGIDQNFRSYTL